MAGFPFRNLSLLWQRFRAEPRALTTNRHFYLPAIAFLGGFLWDAFTLGRYVRATDLLILSGYLLVASGIVLWLGKRHGKRYRLPTAGELRAQTAMPVSGWLTLCADANCRRRMVSGKTRAVEAGRGHPDIGILLVRGS